MIREAFCTRASQRGIYRERPERINGFSLNDDAARADGRPAAGDPDRRVC
jgi:hypothetical protein